MITTTQCNAPLRRRRAAAQRLAILECGCSDPWTCRHDETRADLSPSDLEVDAYVATALSLLNVGLPPAPNVPCLRVMWRRGGAEQLLARRISELWVTA